MLKTKIVGNELVITVHRDYLVNSAECGLTAGGEKTVIDKDACLKHYAAVIEDGDDGSAFNRCLDVIASDAADHTDWIEADYKKPSCFKKRLGIEACNHGCPASNECYTDK